MLRRYRSARQPLSQRPSKPHHLAKQHTRARALSSRWLQHKSDTKKLVWRFARDFTPLHEMNLFVAILVAGLLPVVRGGSGGAMTDLPIVGTSSFSLNGNDWVASGSTREFSGNCSYEQGVGERKKSTLLQRETRYSNKQQCSLRIPLVWGAPLDVRGHLPLLLTRDFGARVLANQQCVALCIWQTLVWVPLLFFILKVKY